jgi:parallel beta-helix repeat protein
LGDIIVDTIWSPSNSPYWIETHVTVLAGVELLVLAGTEVRFNGFYFMMVEGTLLVNGSAIDPAFFTYNGTTPSPADWLGIFVRGETHISHANVSYADIGIRIDSSFNTVNDSFFYRNDVAIALAAGTDNVIRNNTCYNSTYSGIVVSQSTSNQLIGNNATGNNDSGIWLFETTGNLVQQNMLHLNNWNGIRISGSSSSNTIVENTVLESQEFQGIGVWDSFDNWIMNNTIRGNKRNGIYLEQSTGNNISGNEISDSENYHGISLVLANSNVMFGNEISGAGMDGIYIEGSNGNTIQENVIHDNSDGIYTYWCLMTEIKGNNISSNFQGMSSWYSQWSDISFNNISRNLAAGIMLTQGNNDIMIDGNSFFQNTGSSLYSIASDQVVISNNDFLKNGFGVGLVDSSNATVVRNNFTSNSFEGVGLYRSVDVSVHHNNFINNTNQASDNLAAENEWDDGYPSGGNYWSDYTGFDRFSGPNQDLLGSDGLGDSPYVIDTNTSDMYPLTSPFPPSTPMPPLPLDAALTGIGLENVTLTWELSPDDGQRMNSVVRYEIHRNSSYDSEGLGYQFLGSVPNGTSQFVDAQAGEGNPNHFFYRICAVDFNDTSRCSGEQLGKFTRSLSKGVNLVSIPLIQSDEGLHAVLQTVSFDDAWFYDSINQKWKSFVESKPYHGDLGYLNHTMGLWVNVTQDSNLTVAGSVPASTVINLQIGWNLVGFPYFRTNLTVADIKVAVGADRIEGFDGSAAPYFLKALADGDFLQTGFGYWIDVPSGATWIVTNY